MLLYPKPKKSLESTSCGASFGCVLKNDLNYQNARRHLATIKVIMTFFSVVQMRQYKKNSRSPSVVVVPLCHEPSITYSAVNEYSQ